jgi:hypothetical protein
MASRRVLSPADWRRIAYARDLGRGAHPTAAWLKYLIATLKRR